MKTILFQGDSITETGRSKEDDSQIGSGYAALVRGHIGFEHPGEFVFINRGVAGDRVTDMYARIKKDAINLKPDVMSILVGVNDAWLEYWLGGNNGVEAEKYYKIYSMFIEEIQTSLPNTRIMILEPFALKGTSTLEHWDVFYQELRNRADMAKEVAYQYGCVFVPLQEKFNELLRLAPESYWLRDGVHPTKEGHELIKREWLSAFFEIQ